MQIKYFILRPAILTVALFFLVFLSSFKVSMHPYYISVTEVRLDSKQKTISLSCKMFTDDLQSALNKIYHSPIDLVKKDPKCDSLINLYVKKRIEVWVGNKNIEFKYIGHEIEEEATWCYFESKLPSDEKKVKVISSLLYDFIDSQTNFVHCYYDQVRNSFKLDNPAKEAKFSF